MGEYKNLFKMRHCFFWPSLWKDVKEWVKGCSRCVSNNICRSRKSEIYFSWPITTPFYTIHIYISSHGYLVDKDFVGSTIHQMNSMCDLTQCVISSVVRNINAEVLAKTFMEDVELSFDITSVVVVDSDSKFRSILEEMFTSLKIHFWPFP